MAAKQVDNAFKALISKIMIFLILLLAIYMQNVAVEAKKDSDVEPLGSLMVEMFWPDDSCSDVDLWAQGPSGGPVGYSRRSSVNLNLVRDDLGCVSDSSGRNFENVISRSTQAGPYVVNVHAYSGKFPVDVKVVVSTKNPQSPIGSLNQIITQTVTLQNVGEELTVTRFTLDKDGQLVPGSETQIPIKIRNP